MFRVGNYRNKITRKNELIKLCLICTYINEKKLKYTHCMQYRVESHLPNLTKTL